MRVAAKDRDDPAVAAIMNTAWLAAERIADDHPDHVRCRVRPLHE